MPAMSNRLMSSLARIASTTIPIFHNPILGLRCFCSSPSPSSNKLFVGGLSWSVDEKSLKDAFSSFGEVDEVRIVYDKDSGRSRGFGFVHFVKEEDAVSAKDSMDGKALLGRPLRISFALEKSVGCPLLFLAFPVPEMVTAVVLEFFRHSVSSSYMKSYNREL